MEVEFSRWESRELLRDPRKASPNSKILMAHPLSLGWGKSFEIYRKVWETNPELVACFQGVAGSGCKRSPSPGGWDSILSGKGRIGLLTSPFPVVYVGILDELRALCEDAEGDRHRLSGGGLKKRRKWPKPVVGTSTSAPHMLDATSHASVVIKPEAGKASHSTLEDSRATDDLTSRGHMPSGGGEESGPGNLRDPKRQRPT